MSIEKMSIQLSIIDTTSVLYEGEVESFIAPGEDGLFGVLKDHAPLVSLLKEGKVIIKEKNNSEKEIEISSGFLNLVNNKAIIIV